MAKLWITALFCFPSLLFPSSAVVFTKNGALKGKEKGGTVAFLGVPFASPPIGPLRWKPPTPLVPWNKVRNAFEFPSPCSALAGVIPKPVGSEDCLYLNVWVPSVPLSEKRPVMVYIHGGGLSQGSTSEDSYHGASLAERGNVIVVTIQYRLAEFGYLVHPALSAENSYHASGNYGLMDQMAALKWVKENISEFGGDADNVTLFGESGGATSVCAILASPLSQDLFARAIMQSAPCKALSQSQVEKEGIQRVTTALGKLDFQEQQKFCPEGKQTAQCLRALPARVLLQTPLLEEISRTDFRRTTAQLTVDGYTLPDYPIKLIRSGKGQRVPLLLGHNAAEGEVFVPVFFTPKEMHSQALRFFGGAVVDALYSLYPLGEYQNLLRQAQGIFADHLFNCDVRRIARAKRIGDSSPVYRYLYNFMPQKNGQLASPRHAAEVPFVFQHALEWKQASLTPDESKVEWLFLTYWTQFARTGNPNPPLSGAPVPYWSEFQPEKDNYFILNATPQPGAQYHSEACDLWDSLEPGWGKNSTL